MFDVYIPSKFSSIYTAREFVNSTCLLELLSIVKDGNLLKVFNLCLEPININSVFDLLRVSLFAVKHRVILDHRSYFPLDAQHRNCQRSNEDHPHTF